MLAVVPRTGAELDPAATGSSRPAVSDGLASDHEIPSVEDHTQESANGITQEVYELINSRGEIFLTSGVVNGVYAIRVVSANPKADEPHLKRAFEILVATAEEVLRRSTSDPEVGGLTNGVGGD